MSVWASAVIIMWFVVLVSQFVPLLHGENIPCAWSLGELLFACVKEDLATRLLDYVWSGVGREWHGFRRRTLAEEEVTFDNEKQNWTHLEFVYNFIFLSRRARASQWNQGKRKCHNRESAREDKGSDSALFCEIKPICSGYEDIKLLLGHGNEQVLSRWFSPLPRVLCSPVFSVSYRVGLGPSGRGRDWLNCNVL